MYKSIIPQQRETQQCTWRSLQPDFRHLSEVYQFCMAIGAISSSLGLLYVSPSLPTIWMLVPSRWFPSSIRQWDTLPWSGRTDSPHVSPCSADRLCPMDCPTTEEAFEERGPPGHFQTAPSLLHGHACAVLVWEEMTRPVHSFVRTLQISTGMTHPLIPLMSWYRSLRGKTKPGASHSG